MDFSLDRTGNSTAFVQDRAYAIWQAKTVEMLVPYNSGSIISQIFKGHLVDDYSHEEAGVRMQVNVTAREYEMYKRFIVKTPNNTGF
jgi:hypothetical protein